MKTAMANGDVAEQGLEVLALCAIRLNDMALARTVVDSGTKLGTPKRLSECYAQLSRIDFVEGNFERACTLAKLSLSISPENGLAARVLAKAQACIDRHLRKPDDFEGICKPPLDPTTQPN